MEHGHTTFSTQQVHDVSVFNRRRPANVVPLCFLVHFVENDSSLALRVLGNRYDETRFTMSAYCMGCREEVDGGMIIELYIKTRPQEPANEWFLLRR